MTGMTIQILRLLPGGSISTALWHTNMGVVELAKDRDPQKSCVTFFSETSDVEKCLDFVELGFRWVCILAKKYSESHGAYAAEQEECEQAIKELNYRLREHSLGISSKRGRLSGLILNSSMPR